MDGIVWLVCSWVVVGLLSYIFVTRTGIGPGNQIKEASYRKNQTSNSDQPDWLNEVIAWLSTYKSFPIGLSDHWIKALNEVAKKICVPTQSEVIFEETKALVDVSSYPKISNLESCRNTNGQLVVKAHLHVPATILRVVASENINNYTTITNYNAVINSLVGEIEARLAYIADEVYLMCCFNNCPEMNIQLENVDKPNEKVNFHAKLDGIIRKCITSAVMSINFHDYVASLREEVTEKTSLCGEYSCNEDLAASLHALPNNLQYDRSLFVYEPQKHHQLPKKQQSPNKVCIKVLQAQRLNFEDKTNVRPYVIIEMDEPSQKFTSIASHTVNPHWSQNAEFTINELSDEMLFEVYGFTDDEADKNKFLGLAIAGLSEMRSSDERVHNLQLQSRPYQNDKVSGTLTIQSEFFYDPYIKDNSIRSKAANNHSSYNKISFACDDHYSTLQKPQLNSTSAHNYQLKKSSIPRMSINELTQLHNEGHSILDNVTNRNVDLTELVDRPQCEPLTDHQHAPSARRTSRQLTTYVNADENEPPPQWVELENAQLISNADTDDNANERGRSTRKGRSGKRERSFFGELRDRLTSGHFKPKKRAKSLDAQNPVLDEAPSEPPSRDQSQVRYERFSRAGTVERSGHGESRLPAYSDAPVGPSKLVLELGESGQEKKFYYIPDYVEEQLRATRIMKRGKKLHISNDHSFVAVKSKGNVICDVCGGRIATNFVKQAYQCRDCRLVTHKHCHRKTVYMPCPASTLSEKFIVEDVNWEQLLNRFQNGDEEEFISGENL